MASWDSSVRVYDVVENALRAKYTHKAGVLACAFADRGHIISGGIDKTLKLFDVNTGAETVVGTHDAAVRAVEVCAAGRGREELVVSGGWDETIRFWDRRTPRCVSTSKVPAKVFSMSSCTAAGADGPTRVVAALAGRQVVVFDVGRNLSVPEQQRESSLKYQTRAVKCFPDGTGFALSSIEGRVAMEYFDTSAEVQAHKYAFKCHRARVGDVDTVYPVNALAFHKPFGTFASGGCDGCVFIWDGKNKKRLAQLRKYPTSIAALSFNDSGKLLAIASSYTFEEGEKDGVPPDQIFIREVQEAEVKPKPRS